MEHKELVSVVDCFLTEGCPGKITIPLILGEEKGGVIVAGSKHSKFYGHICDSCGERISVEAFQARSFIVP
jgi:hypothetical protein